MKIREQKMTDTTIEIINFTDPYCTWCWGSEPILRKIQEVYGPQVKLTYRMGGLVEDIADFNDPANGIGGKDWYRQVAEHWVDASLRHQMPVDETIFFDIKDDYRSTYPACIAVKAAECQGEDIGARYLRGLRAGAAAENKAIHRLAVQIELAGEMGLDVERFVEDIDSGRAEQAFRKDLLECREQGVRGFPCYLIRGPKGEMMLRGYTAYDKFEFWFAELSDKPLTLQKLRYDTAQVIDFISRYGNAAPVEIACVYEISIETAQAQLRRMVNNGVLLETRAGNGHLYSVPQGGVVCDIASGIC